MVMQAILRNVKRRRGLMIAACILFLTISLFSSFFVLQEYDHDCYGNDCPVCAFVHAAEQNLQQLNSGAAPGVALFFTIVAILAAAGLWANPVAAATLVSKKVRLDN